MGVWDSMMRSNAAYMSVYSEPSVYIPMIVMAIAAVIGAILLIVWSQWRDCNQDADPEPCKKVKSNTKWAGAGFFGIFVLAAIAAAVAIKWKGLMAAKKALDQGDLASAWGASSHVV